MKDLFEKLYKNKQSEKGHNQKENFITEILSYTLQNDLIFRNRFLQHIGCQNGCYTFDCDMQIAYKEYGKPDILIKLDNHTDIIIECKVDSVQEETQLLRYSQILKESHAFNKHLVFLTKYYERTPESIINVNFKYIRWYEIFDLLSDSVNEISKEFSNYLKSQNMDSNIIPFTSSDINAISYIKASIAKMDCVLNRLSDILASFTGNSIKKDKLQELANWAQYGVIADYAGGLLWLGFYQFDDEMQIALDFTLPLKSLSLSKFDEILQLYNWKTYDNEDDTREWYNAKPLSLFIKDGIFETNAAFHFIEKELKEIKEAGVR